MLSARSGAFGSLLIKPSPVKRREAPVKSFGSIGQPGEHKACGGKRKRETGKAKAERGRKKAFIEETDAGSSEEVPSNEAASKG